VLLNYGPATLRLDRRQWLLPDAATGAPDPTVPIEPTARPRALDGCALDGGAPDGWGRACFGRVVPDPVPR
jgi:hypothetical protein